MKHKMSIDGRSEELLPCPFCGSKAVMYHAMIYPNKKKEHAGAYAFVGCSDPDCILHASGNPKYTRLIFKSKSEDLIIRRWNRRRNVNNVSIQEKEKEENGND